MWRRYFNRIDFPRYTSKWNKRTHPLTKNEIDRKIAKQIQLGNCVACFYNSRISEELKEDFRKRGFNIYTHEGIVQFSWSNRKKIVT